MGKSRKKDNIEMAINKADYQMIIDLAAQHRSKKANFNFSDQLKSINDNELTKLMNQLIKILVEYMEQNLDENATMDWVTLNPEKCKMIGQFIQATTDIGLACIQCDFTTICRAELVHLALLLHGIILTMPATMDYVKNSIAHYCERLFLTGLLDNSEYFLCNVVLYLFKKTLEKKALKADVKRIYAIRKIIPDVMKMDGAHKSQLWTLFTKCAISQTYISIVEGQKLIAFIMALDVDKVLEIHTAIKTSIPGINIKTAIAYGKVYFEAWCYSVKFGNTEMQEVLEISCLEPLIKMAIESQQKHILPLVRKVLNQFFIHKKDVAVSKMMYSMFQPLIWLYVKNPNGLYRANAAQLFLDIFPLEDPDMKVVKNDIEINEQLLMIRELLLDDFPIVRITAILGICVSMSVNWEVFPEEMLKTFFRIIVNQLSHDSAAAEVRVAVVKGLKCLLENPLTVRCLVGILPKMTGLFHDISESVRIAFCQLLLRVKKISAIKYFDIVPTKHLFARLEEDCHGVKKSITNLLHNSYFPKYEDPKVWLGRCLEIIKTERIATRVFFSYASCFISVEDSVRFMIQAARAVHYYVKTKNSSAHVDMEISNKENIRSLTDYISSLEEAVGFSNLNIVSTVMDAIAVMWLSLKAVDVDQGENKRYIKMLVGKIGVTLSDLCLYYKETEAWESVFYVSSFLPSALVPSLGSLCFLRLKSLPPDAAENDYMTLLECLMNQNQAPGLLNLLKEWIEFGLSSSYVSPPAKKRRGRGRSSDGVYHDQIKPYLANRMLNSLLNHRGLQKSTLVHPEVLQEIIYLADNIKRKLQKVNARLITEVEAEFLNLLIYNIVRLSVFLHYNPNNLKTTAVPFLNEFIKWTDETLVKHIRHIDNKRENFNSLIFKICENLSKVLSDATCLMFFDSDSCQYLEFIYTLLGTELGYKFVLIASRFLYKHAASSQFLFLMEDDTVMLQNFFRYLCKIFFLLSNKNMFQKIDTQEQEEIMFTLANVMQIVHNHVYQLSESAQVFKCILKNILDLVSVKTSEIVEEMAEDPFDRLSFPEVGNFFLTIINLKPKLNRTYIKYLTEMFRDSADIDISVWIAYWMIVWNFLTAKNATQPIIKELNNLVLLLEKHLHILYPRGKDAEPSDSQDQPEPVPLQLFQRHCHAELIKLKNRQKSKLRVPRPTKK